MPSPAPRRADAPVVQRVGDCPERGGTRRLYLADDGQHVGRECIRRLPVCRYALRLGGGQVGPVPQESALRLFMRERGAWSGRR
jgi:hypothetical protein